MIELSPSMILFSADVIDRQCIWSECKSSNEAEDRTYLWKTIEVFYDERQVSHRLQHHFNPSDAPISKSCQSAVVWKCMAMNSDSAGSKWQVHTMSSSLGLPSHCLAIVNQLTCLMNPAKSCKSSGQGHRIRSYAISEYAEYLVSMI